MQAVPKDPKSVADDRAKKLSFGGAILAALAASSCCLVPAVVAAFGLGGAGAASAFGAHRPYMLAAAGALLGAGFYFTYRKPKACGCAPSRRTWWLASGIVVLVAVAPQLIARWAGMTNHGVADENLVQGIISVRGIDCEACAAPMSAALTKVGGFYDLQLDVPAQTATVRYQPAPARLEAYIAAINELGYEAMLPNGSDPQ